MTGWLKSELLTHAEIPHGFSTRLAGSAPKPSGSFLATGKQVHGNHIHTVTKDNQLERVECDALITSTPGIAVGVLTADCVPVLLASDGIVAAVHSGWRGTAAAVAPSTLAALGRSDVLIAIGPAIGKASYEVSEDVIQAIATTLPAVHESEYVDRSLGPRPHVDLREAVRLQLVAAGADPARIELVGGDTFADAEMYFSYRRAKEEEGRHLSYVTL